MSRRNRLRGPTYRARLGVDTEVAIAIASSCSLQGTEISARMCTEWVESSGVEAALCVGADGVRPNSDVVPAAALLISEY